jgi:hypothetical protein
MGFRTFSRIRVLAASLATVTATTTLFAIAGTAGPVAAATSNGCPASKTVGTLPTASNVAAGFSNSGSTTTYTFSSLTNENPVGGVPGLIKYCVYPSPSALPTSHTVNATGANGATWVYATGSTNFAFARPGGDKTNIALDGTTGITMGTATWSALPTSQTIILHINDPTVCASLYGSGSSATCFVKPSTGPICNAGDSSVAYNAMPFDVVNCLNPALSFEANQVNEFGDEVGLAGSARTLVSLNVDFQSFACQSGHWYSGDCSSAANATFDWPITANIYAVADCSGTPCPGALLATTTQTQTIPYRPSANSTCPPNSGPAPAGAAWFNPLAPGGGACQNSIGKVLTFTFPATTLPDQVIWTVAFNTSTAGYSPVGSTPICTTSGGCPYDSLNVGDKTYPNAPYAGTDTDPNGAFLNSTFAGAYCDNGLAGTDFLRLDTTCWSAFRPLGEIITTP